MIRGSIFFRTESQTAPTTFGGLIRTSEMRDTPPLVYPENQIISVREQTALPKTGQFLGKFRKILWFQSAL